MYVIYTWFVRAHARKAFNAAAPPLHQMTCLRQWKSESGAHAVRQTRMTWSDCRWVNAIRHTSLLSSRRLDASRTPGATVRSFLLVPVYILVPKLEIPIILTLPAIGCSPEKGAATGRHFKRESEEST